MKIETIRIFNINSLKGLNVIDFSSEPLKSSGLFAITGPTGAGKSTILDVIMLGLFNYVPRLNTTISTNRIEKLGSIVTHYCDQAWVEVEYSCAAGQFRSRWSIQKKKRGEGFRDYEMDLIELPSQRSLGLKKGDIPAENSNKIGLNAKQFLKTILLSQGGFARFLRASKEERTDLLEEITGAKIYREIGRKAFQFKSEKETEIKEQETKLSTIELLDTDQLNQLNTELNTSSLTLTHLKASKSALLRILDLQKLNHNLTLQEKSIENTKVSIFQTTSNFDRSAAKLTNHETVSKHHASIQRYSSTTEIIAKLQTHNETLASKITADNHTISNTLQQASNLTKDSLSLNNLLEKLAEFRSTILSADQARQEALNDGKRIRQTTNNKLTQSTLQKTWINTLVSKAKIDPSEALQLITTHKKSLPTQNQSRAQLQENWKELSAKIEHTKALQLIKKELDSLQHNATKHQQNINAHTKELQLAEKELQPIPEKISKLEQQHLERKAEHRRLLEKGKWKAELEKLEEDEPCPICGSTNHPYAIHKELTEITQIAAELLRIEDQLTQLSRQEKQIKENITTAKVNIDRYQDELVRTNGSIESATSRIQELKSQYEFLNTTLPLQDLVADLQKQQQLTQKALDNLEEILLLNELEELYTTFQESLSTYKLKNEARMKLYAGDDITYDIDVLQDNFNNASERLKLNRINLESNKKQLEENEQLLKDVTTILKPVVDSLNVAKAPDLLQFTLSDNELQAINNLKDKLITLKSSLATKEEAYKENKAKYTAVFEQLTSEEKEHFNKPSQELTTEQASLEKQEASINKVIGSINQKLKTNAELAEKQKDLLKQLKKLKKGAKKYQILAEMIGDSQGKKWAAYAQNLTFMHLISRANARLENLTDRYILYFDPDQDSLIVIDKYAGDKMRSVETLSGGETFLLSLALALSLSDFASNNISIDSLFIDEGFATLDNETLDSVMTTLEKLQDQSGKIIGIISHVESLKDRINTQIKVNKAAEGHSTIEIV